MRSDLPAPAKFPKPLRLLHWSMAFLMISLLSLGIYIHQIPMEDPTKFDLYPLHRALGVLAFSLVIIRLIWRFLSVTPTMPAGLPWHEKTAAKAAQIFLYLAMFLMPITGYVASSAVPEFPGVTPLLSVWFFGLDLPLLPITKNYDTTLFYIGIHKYIGYAMIAVIAAHIGGALKHRFWDKPELDVLANTSTH